MQRIRCDSVEEDCTCHEEIARLDRWRTPRDSSTGYRRNLITQSHQPDRLGAGGSGAGQYCFPVPDRHYCQPALPLRRHSRLHGRARLPGLGLLLIPVGHDEERRRRLRAPGSAALSQLDLNNPAQRSTVAFVLSFVVIFILVSAVGSYKAYEFTDSVQFCGQLCHSVMNPEYTAYQARRTRAWPAWTATWDPAQAGM